MRLYQVWNWRNVFKSIIAEILALHLSFKVLNFHFLLFAGCSSMCLWSWPRCWSANKELSYFFINRRIWHFKPIAYDPLLVLKVWGFYAAQVSILVLCAFLRFKIWTWQLISIHHSHIPHKLGSIYFSSTLLGVSWTTLLVSFVYLC